MMGIAVKKIKNFQKEFEEALGRVKNRVALSEVRDQFFSRKEGRFAGLAREIEKLSPGEKPQAEKDIHQLLVEMEGRLQAADEKFAEKAKRQKKMDLTLPGAFRYRGGAHPLKLVFREMEEIFLEMGFDTETCQEMETDHYDFGVSNMPSFHPLQDEPADFQVSENRFLRTQTWPVLNRVLKRNMPPVRVIIPGKIYRRGKTDAGHLPVFFRVDGLFVGKGAAFAHLKGVLECVLKGVFPEKIQIRFRPRFCPFTEPSAAVDMGCLFCEQKKHDCPACRGRGWIEIAGGGMVHSQVFKNMNIDPEKYSGFSFELGIDRIAMLRHRVPGIKLFYQNDIRFIRQFS